MNYSIYVCAAGKEEGGANSPPSPLKKPYMYSYFHSQVAMVESNDDAAKGYEVVPSFLRARSGSRTGSHMRRASSAEHLQEESDPDHRIPEVKGAEASCHSESSSPFAQRRADRDSNDPPDLHGFHLATLPRKKKVPTPKTRHVYAMVSKNHGAQENDNSKRTPPSPLPKPKRGGNGRRIGDTKEATAHEEDLQNTATSADMPKLDIVEPVVSGSPPIDSNTVVSADRPTEEDDTVSLQGMPSSEISHEQAEGGQIYAVVNKKTKKGHSKDSAKVSDPSPPTVEDGKDEDKPKKKPPPKPPRIRPPKPAPYSPRAGSPIPSILAKERGSPVPPEPVSPAPHSPSPDPPPIPDRTFVSQLSVEVPATSSLSAATQPPLPPSPGKTHCTCVRHEYTPTVCTFHEHYMYIYMCLFRFHCIISY